MALIDPARDVPDAPDPSRDDVDADCDSDCDSDYDADLCKLSIEQYDSLEDLEQDLHKYAALAGFCVVKKRCPGCAVVPWGLQSNVLSPSGRVWPLRGARRQSQVLGTQL